MRLTRNRASKQRPSLKRPSKGPHNSSRLGPNHTSPTLSTNIITISQRDISTTIPSLKQHSITTKSPKFSSTSPSDLQLENGDLSPLVAVPARRMTTSVQSTRPSSSSPSQQATNHSSNPPQQPLAPQNATAGQFADYPTHQKVFTINMGSNHWLETRDASPNLAKVPTNPFTLTHNLPLKKHQPQYRPYTSPLHHHWRNQARFVEYNDALKSTQAAIGTNELLLQYNDKNNGSADPNSTTQAPTHLHYDATRPAEFLGHLHAIYDDTIGGQYLKRTNSSPLLTQGLTNIGFHVHSRLLRRLKKVYSDHLANPLRPRAPKKQLALDDSTTQHNTQDDDSNDGDIINIKQIFQPETLAPVTRSSTHSAQPHSSSPLLNHIRATQKRNIPKVGREFQDIANVTSFDSLIRIKKNYAIVAAAAATDSSLSSDGASALTIASSDNTSLTRGYDDAAAMSKHPYQHTALKSIADHLRPNSSGLWTNTFNLRKQLTYILPPSTHHVLDTHSQSYYHFSSASDPHLLQQSVDFYPINSFFSQYLATSNHSRKMRNSILRKTALYHTALHSVDPWSMRLLPMRDRIGLAIAKLNPGILAAIFRAHFFSRFPEAEVCTLYNISHIQNIYAQIVARYLGMPCKSININESSNTSTLLIFPKDSIARHLPTVPISQRTKRLVKTFITANRDVVNNLVQTHTATMQSSALKFFQTANSNLNVHRDSHMRYRLEYTQFIWKEFMRLTTNHFMKLHHFQSIGDTQSLLQQDLKYNRNLNDLTSLTALPSASDPSQQYRPDEEFTLVTQSFSDSKSPARVSSSAASLSLTPGRGDATHSTHSTHSTQPHHSSPHHRADEDKADTKSATSSSSFAKTSNKAKEAGPPAKKVKLYHPDREEFPVYPVTPPGPLRSAQLPVMKYRDAFLSAVHSNQIVLVVGGTGCGKSTQLPQFIIDHMDKLGQRDQCRILTTQPRRLPCIALAERVSLEQGVNINNVKHQVELVTQQRQLKHMREQELTTLKPGGANNLSAEQRDQLNSLAPAPSNIDEVSIPVGYRIQLDSVVNANTNLVFSTAGFVLKAITANIIERTMSPFKLKRAVAAHTEMKYHWDSYQKNEGIESPVPEALPPKFFKSKYKPPNRSNIRGLSNFDDDTAILEELYSADTASNQITPVEIQRVRRKIHHKVMRQEQQKQNLLSSMGITESSHNDFNDKVRDDGDDGDNDLIEDDSEMEEFKGTMKPSQFIDRVVSLNHTKHMTAMQQDLEDGSDDEIRYNGEDDGDNAETVSAEELDLTQPELEAFWTSGRALHQQALIDYLRQYSHIVIDEVHESCWATNLLITLVRDVLPHVPHLRFVLMSATLNTNELMTYLNCTALLQIEAATYPVDTHNLYDVLQMVQPSLVVPEVQRGTFLRFLVNQRVLARKKLLVSSQFGMVLRTQSFQRHFAKTNEKGMKSLAKRTPPDHSDDNQRQNNFEPIRGGGSDTGNHLALYTKEIKQSGLARDSSLDQTHNLIDVFTIPQDPHNNADFATSLDANPDDNDDDDSTPSNPTKPKRRLAAILHTDDVLAQTRAKYQLELLDSLGSVQPSVSPTYSTKDRSGGGGGDSDPFNPADERFFLPLQSYNLDDRAQRDYLIQLLNYSPQTLLTAKKLETLGSLDLCKQLVKYIVKNSVPDTELEKKQSRFHPNFSTKGDAVSSTQDNSIFQTPSDNDSTPSTAFHRHDHSTIHPPLKRLTHAPSFVEHDDKYLPTYNRLLPFDGAVAVGSCLHPDATEEDYNYAINTYNDLITNYSFDNGFANPTLPPKPLKAPEPLPFGSILIFASALKLMVELEGVLGQRGFLDSLGGEFEVILLHSQFRESLERIKVPPEPGVRRIILATSIAETSITLPDVTHVIDLGVTKSLVHNSITKVNHFNLEPAVKSSANQRRGRVGRVRPGICYRLFSKQQYENMYPHPRPETMTISPVEAVFYMATLLDNSIQFSLQDGTSSKKVQQVDNNHHHHLDGGDHSKSHFHKRQLLFGANLDQSHNDQNNDMDPADETTIDVPPSPQPDSALSVTDITSGSVNPFIAAFMKSQTTDSSNPEHLPAVSTKIQTSVTNRFLYAFSSRMLHSISPHGISTALKVLYDAGSIDSEGKLTPLGRLTFNFPTSIAGSKILIASLVSGCLEHGLTIAALIENPNIVEINPNDELSHHKLARLGKILNGFPSMLIGSAHVFRLWASSPNPRNFAQQHSLNSDALAQIKQLRRKLLLILRRQDTNLGLRAEPFFLGGSTEGLLYDFDSEQRQDLSNFSQVDRVKFHTLLHAPYYTDLAQAFDSLFDVKNDAHQNTEGDVKNKLWKQHSLYSLAPAHSEDGGKPGEMVASLDQTNLSKSSPYSSIPPSKDSIPSVSAIFPYAIVPTTSAHKTQPLKSTLEQETDTQMVDATALDDENEADEAKIEADNLQFFAGINKKTHFPSQLDKKQTKAAISFTSLLSQLDEELADIDLDQTMGDSIVQNSSNHASKALFQTDFVSALKLLHPEAASAGMLDGAIKAINQDSENDSAKTEEIQNDASDSSPFHNPNLFNEDGEVVGLAQSHNAPQKISQNRLLPLKNGSQSTLEPIQDRSTSTNPTNSSSSSSNAHNNSLSRIRPESIFLDATEPMALLPNQHEKTPYDALVAQASKPNSKSSYGDLQLKPEEVSRQLYELQTGIHRVKAAGPAMYSLNQMKPFIVKYATQLFQHVELLEQLISPQATEGGEIIPPQQVDDLNQLTLPPGSNTPSTAMMNHHVNPFDPIHLRNRSQLKFILASIKSLPLYREYMRLRDNLALANGDRNAIGPLSQQNKELVNQILGQSRPHSGLFRPETKSHSNKSDPNPKFHDLPQAYYSSTSDRGRRKMFNSTDSLVNRLFARRTKQGEISISTNSLSTGRLELQHSPQIPLPHLNTNADSSALISNLLQINLAPAIGFRETSHNGAFYSAELGQAYTKVKAQEITLVAPPSPVLTYSSAVYGEQFSTEVRRVNQVHPLSMILLQQTPQAYGNQLKAQSTMRAQRKRWIQSQERLVNAMLNERQRYLTGGKLLSDRDDDYGTLFAGANVQEETPQWLARTSGLDDMSAANKALTNDEQHRLNSYLYRVNQVDELYDDAEDENGNPKVDPVLGPDELNDFIRLQVKQFESDFRTYTPESVFPSSETKKGTKNANGSRHGGGGNDDEDDHKSGDDHHAPSSRDFGGPDDIVNHILWDLGLDSEHDRTLHLQKHGTKPYFDVKHEEELKLDFLTQLKAQRKSNQQLLDESQIAQQYQEFCTHFDGLSPAERAKHYGRHNYNQTMSGFAGVQSNFPVLDEVISVIHASLSAQDLLDSSLPTLQPSQDVTQYQERTSEILFPDQSASVPLEHSFVALLSPLSQVYHLSQDLMNQDNPLSLLSLHATAVETHRNNVTSREMHPSSTMPTPPPRDGSFPRVSGEAAHSRSSQLKRHPLSFIADLQHFNVTGNDFVEVGGGYPMENMMRYIDAVDELTQEHVDYQTQNNPEWAFGASLSDEHVIAQDLPQEYMGKLRAALISDDAKTPKALKTRHDREYSQDVLREFNHRQGVLLETNLGGAVVSATGSAQHNAGIPTATVLHKDIYGKPLHPLLPSASADRLNTKHRPIPELPLSETKDIASAGYDPVNAHHIPFIDPSSVQNQAVFGTNAALGPTIANTKVQHFTPHQDQIAVHSALHSAWNTTSQEHLNQSISNQLRQATFSLEQSLAKHGFTALDNQYDNNETIWSALHSVHERSSRSKDTTKYQNCIEIGIDDLNTLPSSVNFIDGLPLSSSERRHLLHNPVGAVPADDLTHAVNDTQRYDQSNSPAPLRQSVLNSDLLRSAPEGLVSSRNVEPIPLQHRRIVPSPTSTPVSTHQHAGPLAASHSLSSSETTSSSDGSDVSEDNEQAPPAPITPPSLQSPPTHPALVTFSPDVLTPSAFPSLSTQLHHASHQRDATSATRTDHNNTTTIDALKLQTATTNQLGLNISTTVTTLDGGNTNPLDTPLSKQYQGKYLHNFTPHRIVSRYSAANRANSEDYLVEDSYLERQSLLSHSVFAADDVKNSTDHSAAMRLAQQQFNDYIRMNQFNSMTALKEVYNDYFFRDAGLTAPKRRFELVSDVPEDLSKAGSELPKTPVLDLLPSSIPSHKKNDSLEKVFDRLSNPDQYLNDNFTRSDVSVYDILKLSSYQTRRHLPMPPLLAFGNGDNNTTATDNPMSPYPAIHLKSFTVHQVALPLTTQHNSQTKISLAVRQNKLPGLLRSHQLNRYLNWKSNPSRFSSEYRKALKEAKQKGSNPVVGNANFNKTLIAANRSHVQALALRNAITQHSNFSKLLLYSPQRALQQLSFVSKFPQYLQTAANTMLDNDHDNTTSFLQSTRSLQRNTNKMRTYFYLNLNSHSTATTLQSHYETKTAGKTINQLAVLSGGALTQNSSSRRPFLRFNTDQSLISSSLVTHIAPNSNPAVIGKMDSDSTSTASGSKKNSDTISLVTSMAAAGDINGSPTTNFPHQPQISQSLTSKMGPSTLSPSDFFMPVHLKRRTSYTHVGQRLLSGLTTHPYHISFYYNERLRNLMNSLQYHTPGGNELDLNHSLIAINNDTGFYIDNDFYHDFSTLHQFIQALDQVELDYLSQTRPSKRSLINRIQRLDLHDHEAEVSFGVRGGEGPSNQYSSAQSVDARLASLFSNAAVGSEAAASRRFLNPAFHDDMLTRQETVNRARHLLILNKTHKLLNDILQTEPQHQTMNAMLAENTFVYNHTSGHGGMNHRGLNANSFSPSADNGASATSTIMNPTGNDKIYADLVESMVGFVGETAGQRKLGSSPHHRPQTTRSTHPDEQDPSELNATAADHLFTLLDRNDEDDEHITHRLANANRQLAVLQLDGDHTNTASSEANNATNTLNTNTLSAKQIFALVSGSQKELPPVIQHNLSEAIGRAVFTGLVDHQFTNRLQSELNHYDRVNNIDTENVKITDPHRFLEDGNNFIDPNRFDSMWINHATDAVNAVLRRAPTNFVHKPSRLPTPAYAANDYRKDDDGPDEADVTVMGESDKVDGFEEVNTAMDNQF